MLWIIINLGCLSCTIATNIMSENCNDILHYSRNGHCLSVCDVDDYDDFDYYYYYYDLTLFIFDCSMMDSYGVVGTLAGYWYDNNISSFTNNCPSEYCKLDALYLSNNSHPQREIQCRSPWNGNTCAGCNKEHFSIQFDTTNCIPHHKCTFYDKVWLGWLVVLFTTIAYWCAIILLLVVALKFKFDANIGYAYVMLFYYGVLEHVVKKQNGNDYYAAQCGINKIQYYCDYDIFGIEMESAMLSSLASIGSLEPPFFRYMKFCLHTEVIDHTFLVYIHPFIVLVILAVIAFAAKWSIRLSNIVKRHSIQLVCLLLLLSYSSMSYTSVQLLKPLAIKDRVSDEIEWYFYWSPQISLHKGWRVSYVAIAVLCEVILIAIPLFLLFEKYFVDKFNLNLTRVKPILDQLQGCYKDEYRRFAAFYLLCRQVIYITDLIFDILPVFAITLPDYLFYSVSSKHISLIIICTIIMIIHIWFQPYQKKTLNILDTGILLILFFTVFTSFSSSDGLKLILWILPLAIFVCFMICNSKLGCVLIAVACFGSMAYCCLLMAFPEMQIVVVVIFLCSSYYNIIICKKIFVEAYYKLKGRPSYSYIEEDGTDDLISR